VFRWSLRRRCGVNPVSYLHRPRWVRSVPVYQIEDCSFHRCVQLGKFEADRTITFVPPDGEFELMRYRITENVNLPFKVMPVVEEVGATRVLLNIKAIANFSSQLTANNVVFKIPVPPTTANAFVSVTNGR
jgi:AP-2 complex subunit mu-1